MATQNLKKSEIVSIGFYPIEFSLQNLEITALNEINFKNIYIQCCFALKTKTLKHK